MLTCQKSRPYSTTCCIQEFTSLNGGFTPDLYVICARRLQVTHPCIEVLVGNKVTSSPSLKQNCQIKRGQGCKQSTLQRRKTDATSRWRHSESTCIALHGANKECSIRSLLAVLHGIMTTQNSTLSQTRHGTACS